MAEESNAGGFWSGYVTSNEDVGSVCEDKRRRTEVLEDSIVTEVGPEDNPEFYLEHQLH